MEEGGDEGDVLGQPAVVAPLKIDAQEIVRSSSHVKAHSLERVAQAVRMAARLALGTCATLGT